MTPSPARSAARIRLATAADLDDLLRIERASFAGPWSAAALHEELTHPGARVWLASPGPEPQAYAAFRLIPGEAELLRVAAHPEARRQYLGHDLLRHGLALLRTQGATRCHLEVRADNHGAIQLYQVLGFEQTARRPNYYPGGQSALLFTKEL